MNTNTLHMTARQTFAQAEAAVGQEVASSKTQTVTFLLVWAAVAVPLVWGVLKAWDEVQPMF